MRAKSTKVRDLAGVLKDLERHIKAPINLYKGRRFKNFGLLPREVLANWMICAVGNFEDEDEALTFATDPSGGDGVLINRKDEQIVITEHVFVPKFASTTTSTIEGLLVGSIQNKNKKGRAYAEGKHLIVFSDAIGMWNPNVLSRRIAGSHGFRAVWVIHLNKGGEGGYEYAIALLDLKFGDAPIWTVSIDAGFGSWQVQRVQ
jgi:hypothetical protein